MRCINLWVLSFLFCTSFSSHAAPMQFTFSANYNLETIGSPILNSFTQVSGPQLLYSSGTSISGSFIYDSTAPVSIDPNNTGISFSGSNFTANLDGELISDNNVATVILNNTNTGGEDFIGFYIDPPVGVDLPNDVTGFNRTNTSTGNNFALHNVRFLWLQDGGLDFVSAIENPTTLPPPGHNGATRLAVDFLLLNPDGSLNENVQQIIFFDNVVVTDVSAVPIPGAFFLLGPCLVMLGLAKRR